MGHFNKLLSLMKMHTAPHMTLDCGPGLGGLNHVYGPKCPTSSVIKGIRDEYINIFTRCAIRNQLDILKTVVADACKGQTDMSYNVIPRSKRKDNLLKFDMLMLQPGYLY